MKRVEAIVRPLSVEAVRSAMLAAGATGVTIASVTGHGAQGGVTQKWRGHEYTVSLLPKAIVMTVVDDGDVREVTESVIAAAHTGDLGDGKVIVTSVDDAIRIRTGETGPGALR